MLLRSEWDNVPSFLGRGWVGPASKSVWTVIIRLALARQGRRSSVSVRTGLGKLV
nr:p6 [Pineapple mealybug wilt-associated virus 6]WCR39384.1 p6 [Pineapple mealybug wilt-associated virus 6]